MAVIYCYFLTFAALLFAGSLVQRSQNINRYKNRFFVIAICVNAALLLTEIGIAMGRLYGNRELLLVAFTINYMLSPFMPYTVMLMSRKKWSVQERILMIPGIGIIVLALSSPITGWMFQVDASNEYSRGPLYIVSLLISVYYFIILVIEAYYEYRDADLSEKVYMLAIFGICAIGVYVQFAVSGIASMWTTSAVAMLLYYTFIQELSNKYDILTAVRNRTAYDCAKDKAAKRKQYGLVVCDINGLKPMNDEHGHEQGDLLIMNAAKAITRSFFNVGKVYRIGGDEFCVICEKKDEETILQSLNHLEKIIQNINKTDYHNADVVSISYGMDIHTVEDSRTYKQVFEIADMRMYQMKQEYYKHNEEARARVEKSRKR